MFAGSFCVDEKGHDGGHLYEDPQTLVKRLEDEAAARAEARVATARMSAAPGLTNSQHWAAINAAIDLYREAIALGFGPWPSDRKDAKW